MHTNLSNWDPCSSDSKESACNVGDLGSIPGSGRSSGERNGNPLQYSCLENSMDRGAWRATLLGVAKNQTQTRLNQLHVHPNQGKEQMGQCSRRQWRERECIWKGHRHLKGVKILWEENAAKWPPQDGDAKGWRPGKRKLFSKFLAYYIIGTGKDTSQGWAWPPKPVP